MELNVWRPFANATGLWVWEDFHYIVLDALTAPEGYRVGDLRRLVRLRPLREVARGDV